MRKLDVLRRFPEDYDALCDVFMRHVAFEFVSIDAIPFIEPRKEQEADRFAAAFLVPTNLVLSFFRARFHTEHFEFDEASSFHLNPGNPDLLLRMEAGSLERALALATAEHFGGAYFHSLAKVFGVSPTTMAIRLKEVGLVQAWP